MRSLLRAASIAVCDYNHGNPGLIGGGLLANQFIEGPVWHPDGWMTATWFQGPADEIDLFRQLF